MLGELLVSPDLSDLRRRVEMRGLMQEFPLITTRILEYSARWHASQEVVSINPEGNTSVTTYADLLAASKQCACALRNLGVR